jgi:hypothetical protein
VERNLSEWRLMDVLYESVRLNVCSRKYQKKVASCYQTYSYVHGYTYCNYILITCTLVNFSQASVLNMLLYNSVYNISTLFFYM